MKRQAAAAHNDRRLFAYVFLIFVINIYIFAEIRYPFFGIPFKKLVGDLVGLSKYIIIIPSLFPHTAYFKIVHFYPQKNIL